MAVDIGKRIAEIREQAGLSQSGLAREIGTSQSAISQIEGGERNPSYDMLRQISEALRVSVAHLVGADVEKLTPEEQAHFRNYRGLAPEAKRELEDFAAYLRQKHAGKKRP
jgi:transcriptional regulator with XRE-family HTH domain